jgi:hypothetical protein
MPPEPGSLGWFLDPEDKGVAAAAIAALDATPALAAARAALAIVPAAGLTELARGVAKAVSEVKRLGLGDVLAEAWNKLRGYRAVVEASREAPGDPVQLPLREVEITSTFHPKVGILVNGAPVPGAEVGLTVTLELAIEAGVLHFRGGRLDEVTLAKCRGKGTLSCGKVVLLERPTRELQVPTLRIGAGPPNG